MAEYFRDVDRPEGLLPRERHPRTGRRVPKSRSKGNDARHAAPRRWPIVAAATGLAAAGIVVLAARDDGSSSSRQLDTRTTEATSPGNTDAATTLAVPAVPVTEAATTVPATTTPPTTTPVTTVPPTTAPVPLRLRMEPLPSVVELIPADPNATATYSGDPPTFAFAVDCLGQTCTFPLTVNLPGTVTPEGYNVLNAVGGHIDLTSSAIDTCTGSQGTVYTREIQSTLALTLSGVQQIGDTLYPQRLAGTLTTVVPEAGFVPHVGDAIDRGAETGCPGQTMIITVDAPLSPAAS